MELKNTTVNRKIRKKFPFRSVLKKKTWSKFWLPQTTSIYIFQTGMHLDQLNGSIRTSKRAKNSTVKHPTIHAGDKSRNIQNLPIITEKLS